MGKQFREYLTGPRIYSCSTCGAHTTNYDQIFSKAFRGKYGRAYLFNEVVNVCLGPKEERMLTTGLHTVADLYCNCCHQVLGWKYEQAYDEAEKYKEGKFIIEKAKTTKEDW